MSGYYSYYPESLSPENGSSVSIIQPGDSEADRHVRSGVSKNEHLINMMRGLNFMEKQCVIAIASSKISPETKTHTISYSVEFDKIFCEKFRIDYSYFARLRWEERYNLYSRYGVNKIKVLLVAHTITNMAYTKASK